MNLLVNNKSLIKGCEVIDQTSPGCLNIILEISFSSSSYSSKCIFYYNLFYSNEFNIIK